MPNPYKYAVQSIICSGDVEKAVLFFAKENSLTSAQENDLVVTFFMALVGAENVLDIATRLTEEFSWDNSLANKAQIVFVSDLYREMMFRSFDIPRT